MTSMRTARSGFISRSSTRSRSVGSTVSSLAFFVCSTVFAPFMRVMVRPSMSQECVAIRRDQIDEAELLCLLISVGLGVADGIFGGLRIAAALRGVGAQQGRGVVFELLLHGLVELGALDDGMRGPGVGAGRHGCDVCRLKQEETGRAGTCALRRHVDDDRHRRRADASHHGAQGGEQAAGRVELDQEGIGVDVGGMGERAIEVVLADGLDGVVEAEENHHGLCGLRANATERADTTEQEQQQQERVSGGAKWLHGCAGGGAAGVAAGASACWRPRASELLGSTCRA